MTAKYIVADVFDGLASLEDGSVDLIITSPPFLALRSYLPADHPDKGKEIGSEATPAEFLEVLLRFSSEARRVLAPHGSLCVELGDTYAGSTMSGGDDRGNERYPAGRSGVHPRTDGGRYPDGYSGGSKGHDVSASNGAFDVRPVRGSSGWPLAKSRTLIPSLYQIALAYGFNPLTGLESPAGQWRIRNIVTWARPNPPVGALGDKWRPATSDLVIACVSGKRYWDDLATRKPHSRENFGNLTSDKSNRITGSRADDGQQYYTDKNPSGAPLLDYWVIPPGGYQGAHYAVFPEELVVPCVQAMCPQRVCVTCGEPSRRITETTNAVGVSTGRRSWREDEDTNSTMHTGEHTVSVSTTVTAEKVTLGWTDCGHDDWRPGLILDPFAGSGTTLAVATGHGHDAVGIDIDSRNAELARDRVGPFLFEMV